MNVAGVVMLVIGFFGAILLVLGILSLFQDGNVPLLGRMYGGSFLAVVGLIFAACGFIGFTRMRRPDKHD